MSLKRRLRQDWILSDQITSDGAGRRKITTIYFNTARNRNQQTKTKREKASTRCLGDTLQLHRMKAFWTLDDVIRRVDKIINRDQLRAFERGHQIPCSFVLQKLQDVFKVDFSSCHI